MKKVNSILIVGAVLAVMAFAIGAVSADTMQNVALFKDADASGSWTGHWPEQAVDGQIPYDHVQWWSEGGFVNQTHQWWSVDLGAVYDISQIKIYWAGGTGPRQYNIETAGNDGSYSLLTFVDTICGDWRIDTWNVNVSARFVKITGVEGCSDKIQIAECEVYRVIDTTAPQVSITHPIDGDTLNSAVVTVSGNASDPLGSFGTASGIASVKAAINEEELAYDANTGTFGGQVLHTIQDFTVTVTATDNGGNTNTDTVTVNMQHDRGLHKGQQDDDE